MTMDEEGESWLSPGPRTSSETITFFPPAHVQRGSFLSGGTLDEPQAVPPPPAPFLPLPDEPGPGPAAGDANSVPAHSWPLPQWPVPPSPGEVLLAEFDALYDKYQRRVYRQCLRMIGNAEDAEDLTQEVFLQVFRKAHTFRGESSFSTWLHRLTINTVLMRLRRHRRWRDAVTSMDAAPGGDQEVSDVLTKVSTVPAAATNPLDRISVDVAIAQLSAGYKEIFLLHDLEGYRHDEIAKRLGITEGTSKSQLHKARLRLRALIGRATGEGQGNRCAHGAGKSRKKHGQTPSVAEYVLA